MHCENRNAVVLPLTDTGCLLTQSDGYWGQFKIGKDGHIGDVYENEIPLIAQEWVQACDLALTGEKFKQTFFENIREKQTLVFSRQTEALEVLKVFTDLLGRHIPYACRIQIIQKARNAFLFLQNPSGELEVTQEDVDAAQFLLSKLDFEIYQPQKIQPPIQKK